MTKKPLTMRDMATAELVKRHQERLDKRDKEENISAVCGVLIVFIVFVLGEITGQFLANLMREPAWHSPKGCSLQVQPTK